MGLLAWAMMGLALWHFAIFIPDRFWGGIVGSFCCALVGSIISGFIISGFQVPNNDGLHLLTSLDAIPGALAGLGFAYWLGVRRGQPALDL